MTTLQKLAEQRSCREFENGTKLNWIYMLVHGRLVFLQCPRTKWSHEDQAVLQNTEPNWHIRHEQMEPRPRPSVWTRRWRGGGWWFSKCSMFHYHWARANLAWWVSFQTAKPWWENPILSRAPTSPRPSCLPPPSPPLSFHRALLRFCAAAVSHLSSSHWFFLINRRFTHSSSENSVPSTDAERQNIYNK